MSMVAYARERVRAPPRPALHCVPSHVAHPQGVTGFFAYTPRSPTETRTHWAGLAGERFTVPAGDKYALICLTYFF